MLGTVTPRRFVEERYAQMENAAPEDVEATRMEASWLGHLGNWIEPVVRPLGYDGRMGIVSAAGDGAFVRLDGDVLQLTDARLFQSAAANRLLSFTVPVVAI